MKEEISKLASPIKELTKSDLNKIMMEYDFLTGYNNITKEDLLNLQQTAYRVH